MTIWCAIFLGALQGLTEFLPVSSSGHLVFFQNIFGVETDFLFFSIVLHLATLFAVMLVLWKDIKHLVLNPFCKEAQMLYVATIPTVLIVLVFQGFFKGAFSGAFLPISFMITAVLLFLTEILANKPSGKVTFKTSIITGVAQGLAVLPGISRSGATICVAVLMGVDKKRASRFSFVLSIPIILASMGYEILGAIYSGEAIVSVPILPTFCAFLTAFVFGVLSVKFMLGAFQKVKLWWFSIYLVILSVISFFII